MTTEYEIRSTACGFRDLTESSMPYCDLPPHPVDTAHHFVERQPRVLTAEPTYTAAEVKVLTETATRLGSEIGRREALDEALSYVETEARWQVELMKRDRDEEWGHSVQRLNVVASCIRNARSAPSGAASDATSGVSRHPEVSEAPKAPQEPCGHPTCPCASQEAKW